jgi:thioesterase domain-containing protein
MKPPDLEQYLHKHIPLSRAMQVSVVETAADSVTLVAPIEPNINHRGTVFGGSISAVAILAAWSLLHTRLRHAGVEARLVIQRNTVHYDAPIEGPFTATASVPAEGGWDTFLRTFARRGKARIAVSSVLEVGGLVAARFEGHFVALAPA